MRIDTSLAILASLGGAEAFWRLECRGRVGLARLDPLIDPGTLSQHAHSIHGSSGFSESATYEDLVNADCTSCGVAEDKSAYWAPTLYFRHANGSYQEVQQDGGMLAYYFLNIDNKDPKKKITAFPNDFRMVAGDSSRRNYSVAGLDPMKPDPPKSQWGHLGQINQHDLRQRAIGFNCLHYGLGDEPALFRHHLPDKAFLDATCIHGVRFELSFPSCWNGKDTSSPDHKSHVAYPDEVLNGNCPDGFDVKLPGLFFETIWRTQDFTGVPGEFVISNGDVSGFGYHGDFISGWDSNLLQAAVNQCTDGSGLMSACPLFTILDVAKQKECKIPALPMLASEKLAGVIGNSLPGGVEIQYGPAPAVHKKPVPEPASVPAAADPVVSIANQLPGGVFQENPTPTPEVIALGEAASPSPTPTPIPSDPPVPEGYELVRTDYVTNGDKVSKIVVIETVEYVMLATETVTVTATLSPEKARRELHQHLHRHRHGHGLH